MLSCVFQNANTHLYFISIFLNLKHIQNNTIDKQIFQFCLEAIYLVLKRANLCN